MLRNSKRKKAVLSLILAVVLAIGLGGCGVHASQEKAREYVQANLDLVFQGETQGAKKFLAASEADLNKMYEKGIQAFVANYLIGEGEIETEADFTDAFGELVEQIFAVQKYQIKESKKTGKDTWEVTVVYRPVNVFTTFIPELQKAGEQIQADAEAGEYSGTDEEIRKSMLFDYMNQSYTLLKNAYLHMEYGEQEKFIFTVTEKKKNQISMDGDELNRFIERILELDKL